MGTLYPGSTTTPGSTGVLANTSTSHPGSTSGSVIYVDASSPYPESTSMGTLGVFPTASIPYPGAHPLQVTRVICRCYPTEPGCKAKFPATLLQKMAYGPNIPPMGMGVPHGPIPDILFPRTPAYVTPNPRVDGEMNEGVRDQITRTPREFGCTPKGHAKSYQKPYPEYFDMIPYRRGFWVPDLAEFTVDDAKTTYEHIAQFLGQVNNMGITNIHKIRMFNGSTSLPPNSIDSWDSLEQKFHDYFYNGEVEINLSDLTSLR
jgi:hypothetical protein